MKIKYIIVHHSAILQNSRDQFERINQAHKKRNWGSPDKPIYAKKSKLGYYIQYHYFIEQSGIVKIGRDESEIGWHSGDFNVNMSSIAIALAGNFEKEFPSGNQAEKLAEILRNFKKKYPNIIIKLHKDVSPTLCPGKNLIIPIINNLIKKSMKLYQDGNNNIILGDETIKFGYTVPTPALLAEIRAHCSKHGIELSEPIKTYMLGWYIVSGTTSFHWKELLNI